MDKNELNTQGQNLEANPVDNGANDIPVQPQGEPAIPAADEKSGAKTYSQQDLDNIAAKARGTAERETKKKFLAELGLTIEDESKLALFKKAYEDSLSEDEKRQAELASLQADKQKLVNDLEEKDYIIKALTALSGKNEQDVEKIVKMAKGLKTESNTIDDAITEVLGMINVQTTPNVDTKPNPNMPKGNEITQPSNNATTVVIDSQENPFKAEHFNLTKQGQIFKENPERARQLAKEAGVKFNF